MVVRHVERQKALSQLPRRKYRTVLSEARFQTSMHGTLELLFAPGITVLCGGNGAGKSTTLGALWQCLADLESYTDFRPAIGAPKWLSSLTVTGSYNDADWETSLEFGTGISIGSCPAPAVFVDAAAETAQLLSIFGDDTQRQELIEGIDANPFDQDQLALLSYVLRRQYESLDVYEVTSFSKDDIATPFFELSSMGNTYSLPGMGRGELCAAYLIWKLSRVDAGSIIFLEEPESHLATWSQKALAEAVTMLIVKRDLTVIASSHSPGFFSHLGSANTVLLSASPVPEMRTNLGSAQLALHLGLGPSKSVLLALEDSVAGEFSRSLILASDLTLSSHISYRYSGSGESGVRRSVSDLSAVDGDRFSVIGVLDGDQRAKDSPEEQQKHLYLVGDASPEVLMRSRTGEWRTGRWNEWTVPLEGGASRLKLALERLDGEDHHDWLHYLALEYGSRTKVIDALTSLVLMDPELATQAAAFCADIRARAQL